MFRGSHQKFKKIRQTRQCFLSKLSLKVITGKWPRNLFIVIFWWLPKGKLQCLKKLYGKSLDPLVSFLEKRCNLDIILANTHAELWQFPLYLAEKIDYLHKNIPYLSKDISLVSTRYFWEGIQSVLALPDAFINFFIWFCKVFP